ncbi:MAG TPA: hypothetical protein VK912_08665 [Longimicrobiales bacterium]|nr:hypothetical protein [Longimicrobiales bacterium]
MSTQHPATVHAAVRERSSGIDRLTQTLRTHPLELLLFGLSIALLIVTTVVTVRVALSADAQARDLTFGGTLEELELVLSNGGFDQLATLEHATLSSSGRALAVDTIAILADPDDEPAAAPGGFIADQVALYNDHAIRQALVRATLGSSVANGVTEAPSLFRTVRTETGERRLSERPNPFVLTVRSPYAERTWREVRTADWSSSGSLLGLGGEIPLGRDAVDRSRAQLNERDCTIRRNAQRLLLYCGTALASDVSRFYDIAFEMSPVDPTLGPARASLYRPGTLWRNGESVSFTEGDVRAGDVFDLERTGPFMLSVSERGTLAAGQWINGAQSFSNQSLGTISFFAAAGRASGASASTAPLVLSLDASFSADLEEEARRFLASQPALRRMSIVVMDVRTGELLAIAEPARRSDGEALLAFEPLLVGSVVKPLVASAILARQPQLAELSLNYAGDTVRVVANVPLERGFANAANGCAGGIAFIDFIRCSSNQYAAELLVRSLRADGYREVGTDGIVPRDILERSAIGAGLAEAFDVDAFGYRTAGRNPALWTAANASGARTADRTLLPWESRPWLLFPETEGTRLDLLARYAFGGWENRWTLLGLGEAYARIATGKEVRARIVSDSTGAADMPANVGNAFRRVRAGLRQVPATGTASGLAADVNDALSRQVTVMAKTGTLNEQRDRFRSLALVVGQTATGPSSATAGSAPLSCGLVAVSWFEFHDGVARPSSLAPVHLEFARDEYAAVLRRHWERVSGCAPGAGGATSTTNPPGAVSPTGARE